MQRPQLTISVHQAGMTLIELVMVIVLLGILGTSFGLFIIPMVNGYNAQVQRASLVDAGESALRRMARDIRIAVPNSVRISAVGSGFALELVPTVDGGRFCATGLIDCGSLAGGLSPTDRQVLDVTNTDSEFDIIGCFQDSDFTTAAGGTTSGYRLVVGNKSSEVYADTGSPKVITPSSSNIALSSDPSAGTCGSGGARHHVTLGASHKFCPDATSDDCNSRTPRQRVFVVKASEAPVSYICNPTPGVQTLTRYWNYTFNGTQPTSAPAGSSSALLATGVSECTISTDTQIASTGIVVISLKLEDRALESVSLMHQAQIDNSQ
jgi:MSHA biogenesis protein MshO